MTTLPEPILFTFPESVFGERLSRYLNLRHLAYTPIRVPPNMPRPILSKLGINYRRIPILALGRSIYIDTRLIIPVLERLYPDSPSHPALGAKDPFGKGVEGMLEGWVIDAGPFWRASGCLPPEAPLLKDDVWMQDRKDGSGGAFTADTQKANRAWCISQLRIFFVVVENMLSDGREWLLGGGNGQGPGLADLHAWAFDWVINIAEDLLVAKEECESAMRDVVAGLNEKEFPRIYAWMKRLRAAVREAERTNDGKKKCGEGEQAEDEVVKRILDAGFVEKDDELIVEEHDTLGLRKGQRVSVGPTDFGFTHIDEGVLLGLTRDEVVIEVEVDASREGKLRLHFPRLGFKILTLGR